MKKYISQKHGVMALIVVILSALVSVNYVMADSSSVYSEFIGSLADLQNKKFQDILITELSEYISRYPDAANLADMHFKKATIYAENHKAVESFLMNLEVVYLYPNSNHLVSAQDRVRALLMQDKKFKRLRDKTEQIVNPDTTDWNREAAHYNLIKTLYYYDFQPITRPLISTCQQFLRHFPKSPNADKVTFWRAALLAHDQQDREALTEYLKTTFLYKNSVYASPSKLKVAELLSRKFKMHQKAVSGLREFLADFPADPQAPLAQFRIAEIFENEMKSYQASIDGYTKVAQNYPQSVEAVPALFRAAKLYEEKLRNYDRAIKDYIGIARNFKDDIKAPYAMAEAGRIYETRLKDYTNSAKAYHQVYELFPESAIAAESLFAAAEINEKKVKNFKTALTHYRTVVDKFPNTKLADRASRRIQKLSKDTSQ